MKIGFHYEEVLDLLYGELLDYIAIDQIMYGAKQKMTEEDEQDAFMQLLNWR